LKKELQKRVHMRHKHVLPVLIYSWEPEILTVSRWYPNGNISQYLESHSDGNKVKMLSQVAEGLAFLHNLKPPMTHGNLKPENVIINDDCDAMLCDFGMTEEKRDAEIGATSSTPARGSAGYIAPEMLDADVPTCAIDVYTLGSLALEVMSKQPPFFKRKYVDAIHAISEGKTPQRKDHPDLPANSVLWPILESCWRFKPEDRPSSEEVSHEFHSPITRQSSWKRFSHRFGWN